MNDLQVESERPLTGEWRYSDGYLYCGTIRIGALSLDTNPTDEVRDEIGEWICKKLNANDSDEDARGASELMRMVSVPQRAFILVETEHDRSGSYDRIVGYSFDKEYIVDEKRSRKMWAKDNGNHHIEYRIEEAQSL